MSNKHFVGESGAGLIKLTMDIMGRLVSVEIDDLIFSKEDKQLISDLFVAAHDNVQKKVDAAATKKIQDLGIISNVGRPANRGLFDDLYLPNRDKK